jgi:hypothetical protein
MGWESKLYDACVNLNLIEAEECETLIELLSGKEAQKMLDTFRCDGCFEACEINDFECPQGHSVMVSRELTNEYGLFEVKGKYLHFRFADAENSFLHGEDSELCKLLFEIAQRGGMDYQCIFSYCTKNSDTGGFYDDKAAREVKAWQEEPRESQFFGGDDYEAQAERIPTMVLQAVLERRLQEG